MDETPEKTKTKYPLTTMGAAERFADRHYGEVRFIPAKREWATYDGKRWAPCGDARVYELVKTTIRAIDRETSEEESDEARIKLRKHAQSCENGRQIDSIIHHASCLQKLRVDLDELDRDQWAFNVLNGTIDLRAGELRPHDPKDLITKLAPVEYQAEATSETWDRFASEALPDEELRRFVQRTVGYALTGSTREQALFISYGPTASGKSTFFGAVSSVLGDYATTADFRSFLRPVRDGGGDKPRPDLVRLQGARLVHASEVSRGQKPDEAALKQITGQDRICVRGLHRAPVVITPTWKIVLTTNERPQIRADDEALWRRLVEVSFDRHVPEERRDPRLPEKLAEPEAQQAILSWAVEGCLAWQQRGLGRPEVVRKATEAYRESVDTALKFVRERLCKAERRAPAAYLFGLCEEFAKENDLPPPTSQKHLGGVLKAEGFEQYRKANGRGWLAALRLEDGSPPPPSRPRRKAGTRSGEPKEESPEDLRRREEEGGSGVSQEARGVAQEGAQCRGRQRDV